MKFTRFLPFAIALFTLAAAGQASAQAAPAGDRSPDVPQARDSRSDADIDAYLRQAVETARIPGLVAMAADADSVLYSGAFGLQNVAQDIPMSVDTIFRIASMTKPVTSVAVVMLIESGEIALDDPISLYLPELAGKEVIDAFDPQDGSFTTRPARGEITIRHLLTNTSGLGYGFSNEILARLTANRPNTGAMDFPLLHDPGTRWTYGESTRVLGRLVEAVSGKDLEQFMRERIFLPLDMNDTSYRVPTEKHGRVVTIHRLDEQGLVENPNPREIASPPFGDGGLHSTAADYVKFIQMFLNGGRAPDGTRLLSQASVELIGQNHIGDVRVELQPTTNPLLSQPFPLGAGRDHFGLGFQITGAHEEAEMRSPGSMSWAGIFNTEFWIDAEKGTGGVLMMQYLPFYDEAAIETLGGFEQRVYRAFGTRVD